MQIIASAIALRLLKKFLNRLNDTKSSKFISKCDTCYRWSNKLPNVQLLVSIIEKPTLTHQAINKSQNLLQKALD